MSKSKYIRESNTLSAMKLKIRIVIDNGTHASERVIIDALESADLNIIF